MNYSFITISESFMHLRTGLITSVFFTPLREISSLKILSLLFFSFLITDDLYAQYGLLQLNPTETQWYQNDLTGDTSCIHTAIRPWRLSDVAPYSRKEELLPDSVIKQPGLWPWVNRKLFQEDFLRFKGKNYNVSINPVIVGSLGQDSEADSDYTYQNTRGARIELALGEKVTAYSTLVETQARLPLHVHRFAEEKEVVPAYWLAKTFRGDAFDYAYAAGEVAFTPSDIFHFRLGHGKQFLGEGYRSMLISDNSVNYPFFRIETQFGRLKYVNTWAIMNDIRPEVAIDDNVYAKKYLSMHYLSMFVGNRFNIGLFEGIMWGDELRRYGFDLNFLNPVILYRPVEFAQGFSGGNILMGLNTSFLITPGIKAYGQIAMDDFKLSELRNWNEGSWLNLYAWQLGVKYGDAFGIRNLFIRTEYNAARPYIYSHREILTNWAHYNQPLAHPWGANFEEFLIQANYRKTRWIAGVGMHIGRVGRDVNNQNYGGDLFKSYTTRFSETDVFIGHGEEHNIMYWNAEVSYIFNPIYNLRLTIGHKSRTESDNGIIGLPNSHYSFFGLTTNIYKMYQDF
ncbi:MAG: hypothetical protein MI974_00470 [Chitinophagales bacterium]|nr:hypothetical protein [Chitinophagales bacterium]